MGLLGKASHAVVVATIAFALGLVAAAAAILRQDHPTDEVPKETLETEEEASQKNSHKKSLNE